MRLDSHGMVPRHKCFDMVLVTLRKEDNSKVDRAYPRNQKKNPAGCNTLKRLAETRDTESDCRHSA